MRFNQNIWKLWIVYDDGESIENGNKTNRRNELHTYKRWAVLALAFWNKTKTQSTERHNIRNTNVRHEMCFETKIAALLPSQCLPSTAAAAAATTAFGKCVRNAAVWVCVNDRVKRFQCGCVPYSTAVVVPCLFICLFACLPACLLGYCRAACNWCAHACIGLCMHHEESGEPKTESKATNRIEWDMLHRVAIVTIAVLRHSAGFQFIFTVHTQTHTHSKLAVYNLYMAILRCDAIEGKSIDRRWKKISNW